MTKQEKTALIISQSVCAMAELMAIQAENMKDVSNREPLSYTYKYFMKIPKDYGIDKQSVEKLLEK